MRIPRLHLDATLAQGQRLTLPRDRARYALDVLRLRAGDPLRVFDGRGHEHDCELVGGRRDAAVSVGEAREPIAESPLRIHLLQGVSRGERMDHTLQKTTELGVARITPILCERTVVKLDEKRAAKRMQHWYGVIVSACEQCGRASVPELDRPMDLDSALELAEPGLLLDPRAEERLLDLASGTAVSLLIGPEGGLSETERGRARAAGFEGARLGPRILRTETAGIIAVALLQGVAGDL